MGAAPRPVVPGPDRSPEAPAIGTTTRSCSSRSTTRPPSRESPRRRSEPSCFPTCRLNPCFGSACGASAGRRCVRSATRRPRNAAWPAVSFASFTAPTRSSASASTRPRSRRIRATSRIRPTTLDEDDESADADQPETPEYLAGRGIPFRRRHRLYGSFALYGGRVEPDNGCEEMLEYFDSYAATDGDTSLVLMGVKMMKVPDEPYIRLPGVLPDRERMIAYEAADVTLAPDPDDLLGLLRAREPGRGHAGARQRAQRRGGRALPPRERRALLRQPRRVRRSAEAADDELEAARAAGRERPPVRPPALPLGRGARPLRAPDDARQEIADRSTRSAVRRYSRVEARACAGTPWRATGDRGIVALVAIVRRPPSFLRRGPIS